MTYRVFTDQLGSPRALVNTTSGAVTGVMTHDAWGVVLQDSVSTLMPFGFAGGLYDAETGLVRFGARDYDPNVGRWISKDPLAFEGDGPNLYAYIESEPVNDVDPSGLSKTDKLYGLAKKFWNWFHRNVKQDGDPDLSRAEAEALHDEWKKLGKPGPDKKGPKRGGNDPTGGGFSDWLDSIIPGPGIPTCILRGTCGCPDPEGT